MDSAAAERSLPVQMCMALPSDLLTSLEFRSTTNYRASEDYASKGNFDIGGSSLLAFALDLRPSKDTRRKLLNRKTTGCQHAAAVKAHEFVQS
eukprot:s3369_g1.t1